IRERRWAVASHDGSGDPAEAAALVDIALARLGAEHDDIAASGEGDLYAALGDLLAETATLIVGAADDIGDETGLWRIGGVEDAGGGRGDAIHFGDDGGDGQRRGVVAVERFKEVIVGTRPGT